MAQNPIAPLDPATTSGTDLADVLTDFEQSILTSYSGTSRPSFAQNGTLWVDSTTNPHILKLYDGTSDITLFQFNTSTHKKLGPASVVTVASAATTDVLGAASELVYVSGTATITSLGSTPLQLKHVYFITGGNTLTHNANIFLPNGGSNITTENDDSCVVYSDNSGVANVISYQRADGEPLVAPAVAAAFPSGTIMLFRQTAAPTGWTKDTSNYNDHAIRVVTGTPSSGGSLNFSTVMGYTATSSQTLSQANLPNFNLNLGSVTASPSLSVGTQVNHSGAGGSATSVVRNLSNSDFQTFSADAGGHNCFDGISLSGDSSGTLTLASGSVSGSVSIGGTLPSGGSGSSFTVPIDTRVRYVDVIFATKT